MPNYLGKFEIKALLMVVVLSELGFHASVRVRLGVVRVDYDQGYGSVVSRNWIDENILEFKWKLD